MSNDSPAFARALHHAKRGLPGTPRNVVRFTNAARFVFEVAASNSAMIAWSTSRSTPASAR